MSQFNLTPAEDALVISALQYLAEVQGSMHGNATDEVQALIVKITATPTIEEKPAKAKKAKAEDEAE
jgi:hypothetical protein